MNKKYIATTAIVAGLSMLSAGSAFAGPTGSNAAEAEKLLSHSTDWFNGKGKYGSAKVTYDGPVIELLSSSHLPAVAGIAKLQRKGFDNLERMSGGKIKVKDTWSKTIHGVKEGRKATRTGLSDYAPCFSLYTAKDYNLVHGLGLPFLFNNSHEAVVTAENLYAKYLKNEHERFKVKIARVAHTSPYHLWTNKPVRSLEDVKGMKIRAGGGIHSQIIAAIGGTQVSMPGADSYTAMQRGTLDGIHFSDAIALIFKTHEVTNYRTTNAFNLLTIEYCLSADWHNKLPADLKVVWNNWARQMAVAEGAGFYDLYDKKNLDKMIGMGQTERIDMAPAELNRWKEAVAPIEAKFIADNEKKGLPAANFIADVKKLAAKYAAMSANDIMDETASNPAQGMY